VTGREERMGESKTSTSTRNGGPKNRERLLPELGRDHKKNTFTARNK